MYVESEIKIPYSIAVKHTSVLEGTENSGGSAQQAAYSSCGHEQRHKEDDCLGPWSWYVV